jgi:hypothetical protein
MKHTLTIEVDGWGLFYIAAGTERLSQTFAERTEALAYLEKNCAKLEEIAERRSVRGCFYNE